MTKLRDDHPFNTATEQIAAAAKEIARQHGHEDVEASIVCSDGERHGIEVPVWQFYIAEATLTSPDSDTAVMA